MSRLLVMAFTIAVPLVAWAVLSIARRRPPDNVAAPIADPAPASLESPGREAFALAAHLQDGNGFPILDWRALEDWARGDAGVSAGRRGWLLHLRDRLAGTRLLETPDAWVLCSFEPNLAHAVAAYVSRTRVRILALLEGIARIPRAERSIFVAFDSRDDYYRYVANYYPDEGEFAFSGGMYINAGCPHFVTPKSELGVLEPVIAHELTHSALAHLKLPLWLDEGIAVTSEHHIATHRSDPRHAIELMGKHLQFWDAARMQEFWSGESFYRSDEGNELSYDLAHHIVSLIGRDWPSFVRFACSAKRSDAGAAAARSELNLDLGELAAAALNVPPHRDWRPRPAAWHGAPRKR